MYIFIYIFKMSKKHYLFNYNEKHMKIFNRIKRKIKEKIFL